MTNMWWLFFLTYVKFINEDRGGIEDYVPFFAGKDFDKKSESYEELERIIQESDDRFNNFEATLIEKASYMLAAWNGGNAKTYEDFKRVDSSLEYIKDDVRKDEALQEVYEDKIKQLAGLEVEMPPLPTGEEIKTEEKHEKETKEKPKRKTKKASVKPEAESA